MANLVWHRLGSVANFIEPFAGSLAILLRRPPDRRGVETINDGTGAVTNVWRATHPTQGNPAAVADAAAAWAECVNDLDPNVANVWRSIQQDPAGVAEHCDQPVNELNLHAMHRWLVLGDGAAEFRDQMRADPHYYDVRRAGYWIAGICQWIGGGWCAQSDRPPQRRPIIGGDNPGSVGKGVHGAGGAASQRHQKPNLHPGTGVNTQGGTSAQNKRTAYPCGGALAAGIHPPRHGRNSRPQLADAFDVGRGVHSHGDLGTCAERRAWLLDWFGRLRDRLRLVRVCCGQWHRICDSPSVTTRLGVTGIFFDAPYRVKLKDGTHNRDAGLYAADEDPDKVVDEVIAYCLERGADPMYRIAACGYEGEGYEILQEAGWECVAWKTQGGYSNQGKSKKAKGKANNNAARERLYFSPHCNRERTLFDNMGPESLDLSEADEE